MVNHHFGKPLGSGAAALMTSIGVGALATPAHATVTTTGCSSSNLCRLNELADGATIQVGNVLFEDWSASGSIISGTPPDLGAEPIETDQISVSGFASDADTVGLLFSFGNTLAISSAFSSFSMGYRATALEATIHSSTLASNTGFDLPNAASEAFGGSSSTTARVVGTSGTQANLLNFASAGFAEAPVADDFDAAAFAAQPSVAVSVSSRLSVRGAGNVGSFISLSQTFSTAAVPEPTAIAGILLAAASGWGLQRSKQRKSADQALP